MTDSWQYTRDRGTNVSTRVVRKVANAVDSDPLEIDPLYETVDPDALDRIFGSPSPSKYDDHVEFTMEGCTVVVYGTGRVEVACPEDSGDDTGESTSPEEDSKRRANLDMD